MGPPAAGLTFTATFTVPASSSALWAACANCVSPVAMNTGDST